MSEDGAAFAGGGAAALAYMAQLTADEASGAMVMVPLGPATLYTVISGLQLACRHPDLSPELREHLARAIAQLSVFFEGTPLAGLVRAGDDPGRDIVRDRPDWLPGGEEPFGPDWCAAPAGTLYDFMRRDHLSVSQCAARVGSTITDRANTEVLLTEVLDREPLTDLHAVLLQALTGAPAAFWLQREADYRDGLARGLKDTSRAVPREEPDASLPDPGTVRRLGRPGPARPGP
jgi:hypothetical protein